ncbi:MAG: transposase, partial [Patescibacteria group bacterium]
MCLGLSQFLRDRQSLTVSFVITDDHVHIVFSIPPRTGLAPFIGRLK